MGRGMGNCGESSPPTVAPPWLLWRSFQFTVTVRAEQGIVWKPPKKMKREVIQVAGKTLMCDIFPLILACIDPVDCTAG